MCITVFQKAFTLISFNLINIIPVMIKTLQALVFKKQDHERLIDMALKVEYDI